MQLSQELNLSARTTRTLPEDCTTALLACIRGVCCALCTLLDLATNVCVDEFVEFFLQAKARGSTYGETHTSLEHRWISNVPPALRDELVDLLMMGDLRLSSQVLALLQKLHRRQGSLLGAVQSLVFLEDPGLRGSFEERHTACQQIMDAVDELPAAIRAGQPYTALSRRLEHLCALVAPPENDSSPERGGGGIGPSILLLCAFVRLFPHSSKSCSIVPWRKRPCGRQVRRISKHTVRTARVSHRVLSLPSRCCR